MNKQVLLSRVSILVCAGLLGGVLLGCSSSQKNEEDSSVLVGKTQSAQGASPSDSRSSTGTAAPSSTGSPSSYVTGRPAPSSTGSPSSYVTGRPAPSSTGSPSSYVTGRPAPSPLPDVNPGAKECQTNQLSASIAASDGAAGSYYVTVRLTNVGKNRCSVRGYPSVSFVDVQGKQIGASATRESAKMPTVVLSPASTVDFTVRIANAQNYNDSCEYAEAAGLRIYPPGQQQALPVLEYGSQACANPGIQLLEVSPVGA